MMDQMDLFAIDPSEEWVYDQLRETLLSVIHKNNLSPSKLVYEKGKNYSSVWYDTQMAFRICCRDDYHYFGVSDAYTTAATADITEHVTTTGRVKGFTNYAFDPTAEGISVFADFLAAVLALTTDSIPKGFDCCSRYEACSDAKRCIHPNPDFAAACGYRKIMKSGRIFYGTNRNI